MRWALGLLLGCAVTVTGCAKYAKVKNPEPVRDLEATVSLVRVSRIFRATNAEERIVFDLRVRAPRDRYVRVDRAPVSFMPPAGSRVETLAGRLESVQPDRFRRGTGVLIGPRQTARVIAGVRVPEERMAPGREYRVRLKWCTSTTETGPCRAEESRMYELRVVQVNYAAVAGLGLVLAGALFAVGGS